MSETDFKEMEVPTLVFGEVENVVNERRKAHRHS